MSRHLVIIEAGNHSISGSWGWSYVADKKAVYFGSLNHNYYFIANGNFIGKEVIVDLKGYASKFVGIVKPPKNPIYNYLWNKGFYKCHMIQPNSQSWDWNVKDQISGDFVLEDCYQGHYTLDSDIVERYVVDSNDIVMIAYATGRIYSRNDVLNIAMVSPAATIRHLDAIKSINEKDLKVKKIIEEDLQMDIKLIERKEQNPFADARFCNNGGGYFQPYILKEIYFRGEKYYFELNDSSCGDFGYRYSKILYDKNKKMLAEYYINEVDSDNKYYGESNFNYSTPIVRALLYNKLLKYSEINFDK